MPTWRQNDFDEAFGELILWSQAQVLVGPQIVKATDLGQWLLGSLEVLKMRGGWC